MTARPIIFSAPMIRALLAGEKTQTRRIVKPQPPCGCSYAINGAHSHALCYQTGDNSVWVPPTATSVDHRLPCPYGQPGDLLYVKETHQYADWTDDGEPLMRYRADESTKWCEGAPEAVFDIWATLSEEENYAIDQKAADRRWRPSIHMPRWASRLTLRITDVRVQRLQEISEADARAEGAPLELRLLDSVRLGATASHTGGFERLWESIHGPDSWAANPWVWVIEFRRVEA